MGTSGVHHGHPFLLEHLGESERRIISLRYFGTTSDKSCIQGMAYEI